MKDTKPVDIAKKHREDVIDTLQLRYKERRVLYGLLLILLVTVAYENSAFLYERLLGGSHPLPQLGERRPPQLRHDMLKQLDRALAEASEDFPQYWARFSMNQKRLANAAAMLAEEGMTDAALEQVVLVAASMNEFAAHPLIKPTKNLERLNSEIASIQRILKLKVDNSEAELKPLGFAKDSGAAGDRPVRDLFEYSLR